MIHLDTSFLIRALVRGTPEDAALRRWLAAGTSLAIDALVWAEFLCGPLTADGVEAAKGLLGEPVPFGAAEATLAARLFNESGRRRGTLVDCMIAAGALQRGAALATSDIADFRRLEAFGLELIRPEE